MWSSVSIPGSPRILMVDATQDQQKWEYVFSDRLCGSLRRSGLQLPANASIRIRHATELIPALHDLPFNCLIFLAHGESLRSFWNLLRAQNELPLFLLAVCSFQSFDAKVSEEILKSDPPVAPLAVAPQSPMSPREAGLFYLKFFTELKLHSAEKISGKMVWFSFSKAKELMRRRRYSARFGVRC